MNSKNIPNSDPYRLRCTLLDLYTLRIIKSPCKNNQFKILALTWDEEFELRMLFSIRHSRLF